MENSVDSEVFRQNFPFEGFCFTRFESIELLLIERFVPVPILFTTSHLIANALDARSPRPVSVTDPNQYGWIP